MSKQLKDGDIVYSQHGQEAVYVAPAQSSGHIVEPVLETEYGEPAYSDPEVWQQVFLKPPKPKFDAETARLDAMIDEKRKVLRGIESEAREAEQNRIAAIQRLRQHPDLTGLDLWLQGKITHIVSLEYYSVRIGTVEETLREDGRDKELRLLSLRADPKASRFWVGYSAYSDGSGSQTRCLLATSLKHAQQLAAEHVENEIKKSPSNDHSSLVMSAHKQGVAVPADRLEAASQKASKAHTEKVERARQELARKQEELRILESQS